MSSPQLTPPPKTPPPIKGSWESLLQQANQLNENRNEEALTIYNKLITRLQKMPEAMLEDQGRRLYQIFETSCVGAANLSNSLERFDNAIEHLDTLYGILPDPDDKFSVRQAKIRTLQMMDRHDEALTLALEKPDDDDSPLNPLFRAFGIALDARDLVTAQTQLDEMETRLFDDTHKLIRSENEYANDLGQFHSMASILALELEEWEKGISAYRQAQAASPAFADEGGYLLYSNLVHRGEPELALPIIAEESLQVRRQYWEGLARYGMGDGEAANALWEAIVSEDLDEAEAEAFMDLVLTHYYLGDKQRVGLEMMLRMLNEMETPTWHLFFFAAVGWGIRENETNTLVNLEHAIDIYRRNAMGRYLPWTLWPPIRDLFSAQMQAQTRPYFNEKDLTHYFEG